MPASNVNNEVKHEAEVNNFAILEELKLFFMNKCRSSELQNCSWYNRVLEMYNAELVYDEEERAYKLWVNDEPLESQNAIQSLIRMIESLQSDAQRIVGPSDYNSVVSSVNTHIEVHAGRDVNVLMGPVTAEKVYVGGSHTHNHEKPLLDEAALNAKETLVLSQLKASYSTPEYTTIPGIFGSPLKLEGQYINLQILCTDLKTKKTEEKESEDSGEIKRDEKYKDARMPV